MKRCNKCRKLKPLDCFYNDKRLLDGKHGECIECNKLHQKSFRSKNKEKIKEYNKKSYNKTKLNPLKYKRILELARKRYSIIGRKKYDFICEVCGCNFRSVRRKVRFCSLKCLSSGKNNGRWLGGRQRMSSGYITIYSPYHPNKSINNNVLEHRLVMEKYLGRFLRKEEVVHHKNGVVDDNRIENLQLCGNNSEHSKIHSKKGIKGAVSLKS